MLYSHDEDITDRPGTRQAAPNEATRKPGALPTPFERTKLKDSTARTRQWPHPARTIYPTGLEKLTALERFDVHGNKLMALPDCVRKLRSLKVLNVSGNHLRAVPCSVRRLHKLEELFLGGNRLKAVPNRIGELIALQDEPDLLSPSSSGSGSVWGEVGWGPTPSFEFPY